MYNEEKRIQSGLTQVMEYLQKQTYAWEVVLVIDGATDKTHEIAKSIVRNITHQLFVFPKNMGKGAAIRKGMQIARGKYVIFCDVDMSTPISTLEPMLEELKTHEVVIGIRRHKQAKVKKHQPLIRESLGRIFTWLTNTLVVRDINDATCGFKGFQKDVAKQISSVSKIDRWAFDGELLHIAQKKDYAIKQLPVVWKDDTRTKVKMLRDGYVALRDLVRIRYYSLRGQYE